MKVKVSELNARILKIAEKISKAVELEANEVLEHAEEVIKNFVPARLVKRALLNLEESMDNEGVEALFDKTVTREALKKTASEEVSDKEIQEVVEEIVKAIVEEFEDVLKDADEVADEEIQKIATELEDVDSTEIEAKLKGVLERSLHAKGVYAKFARTSVKQKTLADKIREARKQMKK